MFKKLGLCILMVALVMSCKTAANRKGYVYDNHRFNYIKAEKFKNVGSRNINHPYEFTEPQISQILKAVEVKKGVLLSKDEKIKSVFDGRAVEKLTPNLVKAFSELKPTERLAFSFLSKDPFYVIRDDHLTNGFMWVEDNKLHIQFETFYATMTGDYDKMGYSASRQANNARGLKVELDLKVGQTFGDSTRELVVDPAVYAQTLVETPKSEVTKAGSKKASEAAVKTEAVKKEKDAKERLHELEVLKKEKMISDEEYKLKREEILKQL